MYRWPARRSYRACKSKNVKFKMKNLSQKQWRRYSEALKRGVSDEVWNAGIIVCDVAGSDSIGGLLVDI
jgi:hypothetical protein